MVSTRPKKVFVISGVSLFLVAADVTNDLSEPIFGINV